MLLEEPPNRCQVAPIQPSWEDPTCEQIGLPLKA